MCHPAEAVSTEPVLQALSPSDPGISQALQTRASVFEIQPIKEALGLCSLDFPTPVPVWSQQPVVMDRFSGL